MTSSTHSTPREPSRGYFMEMFPYVTPPLAASVAIIPIFRDLVVKSALQKGAPTPYMSVMDGIRGGVQAAPTVGVIVGTQMVFQRVLEKILMGNKDTKEMATLLVSSAIVGTASSPILAVFNGQTMGWTVVESMRRLSVRQCAAISVQETAFVGGLSAADRLAEEMRRHCGNSKTVDYVAAFISGYLGSLAGHPANTALTRWQSGMKIENVTQLMWGAARKARAMGLFSVGYKAVSDIFKCYSDKV